MKLHIEGNINAYYVQTLCMIFFPGEKFAPGEEEDQNEMTLSLTEGEEGFSAVCRLRYDGKETCCEKMHERREDITEDRQRKLVVGHAVLRAAEELLK